MHCNDNVVYPIDPTHHVYKAASISAPYYPLSCSGGIAIIAPAGLIAGDAWVNFNGQRKSFAVAGCFIDTLGVLDMDTVR